MAWRVQNVIIDGMFKKIGIAKISSFYKKYPRLQINKKKLIMAVC